MDVWFQSEIFGNICVCSIYKYKSEIKFIEVKEEIIWMLGRYLTKQWIFGVVFVKNKIYLFQ